MYRDYPMVRAHLKELLERSGLFPKEAELTVRAGTGNAILVSCSWLLGIDPDQPDRRSTSIEIAVHARLAERYRRADADTLKRLDQALVQKVARRMKRYHADHGLPYHRLPPPFEIQVNELDVD